jgi:aspartate ammonia-lyase
LLENGARLFREKCVQDLQADERRGQAHVLESSAIASAFLGQFGYNTVSAVVKKAARNGRPFLEEMQAEGLISTDDALELVRKAAQVVPSGK